MIKSKFFLIFFCLCLLIFQGIVTADDFYKPVRNTDTLDNVFVEILPRVELLAGVLSQTTWIDINGPQSKGNEYYRDLKSFFTQYKDDEAIKIAQDLTNRGFTYDAPPNFILSLGPLPDLKLENGYSEYLINRADGKNILGKFRLALIDLAQKSDFNTFFEKHRDDFQSYLDIIMKEFDARKVINWEQNFFGWSGDEFHLVLAPAMFPGGGYGATIEKPDGKKIIYQVVRERGSSENEPEFPSGTSLELLALHEWGHSFVNPSVAKYSNLIDELDLSDFYKPVKKIMRKQAYSSIETFFNEQILRAVTVLAVKDLYDEDLYRDQLKYNTERGFYLTEYTIEQLEYYRNHRDEFNTFDKFIPYLFANYSDNLEKLTKEVSNNGRMFKGIIVLLGVLLVSITLLKI